MTKGGRKPAGDRDVTPRTDNRPPKPFMAVIRPFTTRIFNPFSRLFVRWLPGFGILVYRGRKSGAPTARR